MPRRSAQESLDVTSGVIWKQLLTLFVPVFLSSFFQQTYSLANAWVVGRFAGKDALAAMEATVTLNDLVVSFSVGMGVGFGVVVSQHFGSHDDEGVSRAVRTAMGIAIIGGMGCSVLGVLLVGGALRLMGTPAEIYAQSLLYSRIYMSAMLFSIVFNTGSALQRAVGDTRTPSLIVALSCVVNISLDLLLVAGLHMGVEGCAIATFATLVLSSAATLHALARAEGPWRMRLREVRIDRRMARAMLRTGVPLGVQGSVYSVSNIVAQSAINGLGTDVVAGWGLSGRIDSVIWMVSDALGSSVTTFAAQNFGARNYDRMRQGVRTSLSLAVVVVGGVSALLVVFAYPISYFFMRDMVVAGISTRVLLFIGPFYVFYSFMDNFAGTIRGAGESFMPMLLTILGTCVFRLVWLLGFVPSHHTLNMIMLGYPVTWILTCALFVAYYFRGGWLRRADRRTQSRQAA